MRSREALLIVFVLLFNTGLAGTQVDSPSAIPGDLEFTCRPMAGLDDLLVPGKIILLGELHGTVESPGFVHDLACHAARSGLSLTVGLELSPVEQEDVDRYLDSRGGEADRAALVSGDTWQRDYQDGRNSRAMAELIDGLRVLREKGHSVTAVLFDVGGGGARDARMAETLATVATQNPDGLVLVLTGNLHSRVVSSGGTDPMGFLLSQSVGSDRVLSLDVAYLGGSSWLCFATTEGQQCGVVKLKGRGPEGEEEIVLCGSVGSNDHHGWYRIGEIQASPPAKLGFAARPRSPADRS